MMTAVDGFYGGLSALADALQVERIGPMHQAGSDSLLTAQTYFALVSKNLGGVCDDSKFRGELFGIGTNHTKYKNDRSNNNKVAQAIGQGVSINGSVHTMYASNIMYGGVSSQSSIHQNKTYQLNSLGGEDNNQPVEGY
jgi:CCR4-NOT transcription complex subunit 7/8